MGLIRLVFFTFTIFFLLAVLHTQAYAAENFQTDYAVTYTIAETGVTHAELRITLTNTTSDYYAANYTIQVGFENIAKVTARDAGGAIRPVISKSDEGQQIALTFNKPVVGIGNKQQFSVGFDTLEIAHRSGKIWEINIPGISSKNNFNSFTVEVKVPETFGKPAYIKPQQVSNSLVFQKEQLEDTGISIAFGEKQLYAFRLTYHLKNKNVFPIKTEIALPPSTNYQEVFIQSMIPKPENVTIDKDGNWLAHYQLLPSQNIDVSVRGKAEVHLVPKKQAITDNERRAYLKPLAHWEITQGTKADAISNLNTPKEIYDYVVDTLTYDFSRVTNNAERLGAQNVLANPTSAVCREFTDLFIALARRAGIPAREVNGFAYTQNSKQRPLSLLRDILHAWPEYYDVTRQTWVMVDPTWGNTTNGVDYFATLDFDHFAFVIKGTESEYPIPAGGYKYPGDENKKDVEVTFADSVPEFVNEISLQATAQPEYIAGFPIVATLNVANTGTSQTTAHLASVQARTLTPLQSTLAIDPIPPFGRRELPISFTKTSLLTNTEDLLTITVKGKTITQHVKVLPVFMTKWAIVGGSISGILTIIIFVVARRTRRLPIL